GTGACTWMVPAFWNVRVTVIVVPTTGRLGRPLTASPGLVVGVSGSEMISGVCGRTVSCALESVGVTVPPATDAPVRVSVVWLTSVNDRNAWAVPLPLVDGEMTTLRTSTGPADALTMRGGCSLPVA